VRDTKRLAFGIILLLAILVAAGAMESAVLCGSPIPSTCGSYLSRGVTLVLAPAVALVIIFVARKLLGQGKE